MPFAAGILYTNDVDYQLARLLATEVVQADPFEPVSEDCVKQALRLVESCQEVWMAPFPVTALNQNVQKVIDAAKAQQKLIIME